MLGRVLIFSLIFSLQALGSMPVEAKSRCLPLLEWVLNLQTTFETSKEIPKSRKPPVDEIWAGQEKGYIRVDTLPPELFPDSSKFGEVKSTSLKLPERFEDFPQAELGEITNVIPIGPDGAGGNSIIRFGSVIHEGREIPVLWKTFMPAASRVGAKNTKLTALRDPKSPLSEMTRLNEAKSYYLLDQLGILKFYGVRQIEGFWYSAFQIMPGRVLIEGDILKGSIELQSMKDMEVIFERLELAGITSDGALMDLQLFLTTHNRVRLIDPGQMLEYADVPAECGVNSIKGRFTYWREVLLSGMGRTEGLEYLDWLKSESVETWTALVERLRNYREISDKDVEREQTSAQKRTLERYRLLYRTFEDYLVQEAPGP